MLDLVQKGKYKGFPKSLVPVFRRYPELFNDIKSLADRGVNLLEDEEYGRSPKQEDFVRLARSYRKGIIPKARLLAELTSFYLDLLKWQTAKLYFQEVGIPSRTREYQLTNDTVVSPPDTYEAVKILEEGIQLLEPLLEESYPDRGDSDKIEDDRREAGSQSLERLSPAQKAIRYFDSFIERKLPDRTVRRLRPSVRKAVIEILESSDAVLTFEAVLAGTRDALDMPEETVRPFVFQTLQESTMPCITTNERSYIPLNVIYTGVKFRMSPGRKELWGGYLMVEKHFPAVLLNPRHHSFSFLDPAGTEIPALIFELARARDGMDLREWFLQKGFSFGDDIVVTIASYHNRAFLMEHEKRADRNEAAIARRNERLADIFVRLLRTAPGKRMFLNALLPFAYAEFEFSRGYPPDHWRIVAGKDPRLAMVGWEEMKLVDEDRELTP